MQESGKAGELSDIFGENPLNQPSAFAGRNLFECDPLIVALADGMSALIRADFSQIGQAWGTADSFQLSVLANTNPPVLKTHDAQGRRTDRIDYHPAYHALMRRSMAVGLQGSLWDEASTTQETGLHHQARAIRLYLASQVETGHLAVLSTTSAAPAALRFAPGLAAEWLPMIRSRHYDSSEKPALMKNGVTLTLAITEKQGGALSAPLVTRAERQADNSWRLIGHKWYVSAPMSDGFLILAQTSNGLSCFFAPRLLADGADNKIRLQQLKDKLGNRSNASVAIELHGTRAILVGAEGHGMRTIVDMLTLMRLDGAVMVAGMMRAALGHAVHHMRGRFSGEVPLLDQPLATRVLADMALDSAAATALCLRLAEAFDRAPHSPRDMLFARLMTPVIKYWTAKIAPGFMAEAMDAMGSNAYEAESVVARLYREAPAHLMFETSSNLLCLDVLRVLRANPDALEMVHSLVEANFGTSGTALFNVVQKVARAALLDEGQARMLSEQLALTIAAAELQRIARPDIADAFLERRLARGFSASYGMLDSRFNARSIIEAIVPA